MNQRTRRILIVVTIVLGVLAIALISVNSISEGRANNTAVRLQQQIKPGMTVRDVLKVGKTFASFHPITMSVSPDATPGPAWFTGSRGTAFYFPSSYAGWLCINEVAIIVNYRFVNNTLRVVNTEKQPAFTCV